MRFALPFGIHCLMTVMWIARVSYVHQQHCCFLKFCTELLGIASGVNEIEELAMSESNKRQDSFLEERILGL